MAGDKQNGGSDSPTEIAIGIICVLVIMYFIGIPVLSFINEFFNVIGDF